MAIKLDTETQAGVVETGTEATEAAVEKTPEQEVASFYDATKAPETLQPFFREMQAAACLDQEELRHALMLANGG